MRRSTKIQLIIAACLVLVGGILFGGVMMRYAWDFSKISTSKYETNSYAPDEDFRNISIIADTAEILLVPAEGDIRSVVCYEQKNVKHTVAVQDGTLVIEVSDARKWYEHIGIQFGRPQITVFLPKGEYDALLISSDTGDVQVPCEFTFSSIDISVTTGDVAVKASALNGVRIATGTGQIGVAGISAAALDLSATTGKVRVSDVVCAGDVGVKVSTGKAFLTDITCKTLVSNGDTGDLSLKNVIAAEKFSIERTTGDVKLDGCDAAEIFVKTDTGNVSGTLLSEKVFIVDTHTGKKEVPDSVCGGRCKIETDTGDVKISLQQ